MKIKIITLFPEFIRAYAGFSLVKRAQFLGLAQIEGIDLRKYGIGARAVVDDRPYGGGAGMVIRPDVVQSALKSVCARRSKHRRIILLSPQGKTFTSRDAQSLSNYKELVLICGRYEGWDERVRDMVDEEISIGDYVLMGGELPSLVLTEAVLRHVPRVLGKERSLGDESFEDGLLEYAQYTKPEKLKVKGRISRVPSVLLTGHHANVKDWREQNSIQRTQARRPDLYRKWNTKNL